MSNDPKVVCLPGGTLPDQAPDVEVVELLERYLEQARRGEIVGIAVALARPNGDDITAWTCTGPWGHSLYAGVSRLAWEMSSSRSKGAK